MKMNKWACIALGMAFSTASFAQIKINEYSYDDSGTDDIEFIELYNAGTTAIDISGWLVECADDAFPADNNADYTVNAGTVLAPGQYYVMGSALVPNVNQVIGINNIFENDKEGVAIKNLSGVVQDALGCEMNKAPVLDAQFFEGNGSFGNDQTVESTTSADGNAFTLQRYKDGLDTNFNGADFGHAPRTPGSANWTGRTGKSFSTNFDSGSVGDMVPGLVGMFRNPRIIDPTVTDGVQHLTALPPSPQGGNACTTWDWAGGGNSIASTMLYEGYSGYETWVYINNAFTGATEAEQWSIGVLGTSDALYNYWSFAFPDANGNSGVSWSFKRNANECLIALVDSGRQGETSATWQIFGSVDLTVFSPGWYRLRLEVTRGKVRGWFGGDYGSTNTGTEFSGNLTNNRGIGRFYIGFREGISANASATPVTLDDLRVWGASH